MHTGQNISRIRELLGIKQESLAQELNVSQQTISKIEQTEQLNQSTVERIAKALKVSITMLTEFDEQKVRQIILGQQANMNGACYCLNGSLRYSNKLSINKNSPV